MLGVVGLELVEGGLACRAEVEVVAIEALKAHSHDGKIANIAYRVVILRKREMRGGRGRGGLARRFTKTKRKEDGLDTSSDALLTAMASQICSL